MKDSYYLDICSEIARASTCLKMQVGAVIVKNNEIVSTGCNSSPPGIIKCTDIGYCVRKDKEIPSKYLLGFCPANHAEESALLSAARKGVCLEGATLYCTHSPCFMCTKMILRSGISRVVCRYKYEDPRAAKLWQISGLEVIIQYDNIVFRKDE